MGKIIDKISFLYDVIDSTLHKQEIKTMVGYYSRNSHLPKAMMTRATQLCHMYNELFPKVTKEEKVNRQYLYAITNSKELKVGYTADLKNRLKSLQTSSPLPLSLVWNTFCGQTVSEAKNQERKLHRRLKEYHIRGEWYDISCLPIVNSWSVYNQDVSDESRADNLNTELDRLFLVSIQ